MTHCPYCKDECGDGTLCDTCHAVSHDDCVEKNAGKCPSCSYQIHGTLEHDCALLLSVLHAYEEQVKVAQTARGRLVMACVAFALSCGPTGYLIGVLARELFL